MGWASSSKLFHFAQGMLVEAASFDLSMTAAGLRHPPVLDYGRTRLDFSRTLREAGSARFAGARNPYAVCGTYVAADGLLLWAAARGSRRGRWWRTLASAALLAQAVAHFEGGASWVGLPGRLSAPYARFGPQWTW